MTRTRTIAGSSFDRLSEDELETHIKIDQYGSMTLTDAVRPSYDLQVIPKEGYRHDVYKDKSSRTQIPVLIAAVSRQRLFELFIELLDPLGATVDVVLETSHGSETGEHRDLYRDDIDLPILTSTLRDFEDLLMNDGFTGIAVLNPDIPQEVQFDEHKLLIVYGAPLEPFERILREYQVRLNQQMKFIIEGDHMHSSSKTFASEFEKLATRLGLDGDGGEDLDELAV